MCILQSIEGEVERLQINLEDFHCSQRQFCQNFSQEIGEYICAPL